ncbi:hypothetical protein J1605_016177 [Eschrichtius robustus]|uniref:Uncharacterized protein n=1 Tax=Eschrichtius robustus TaxID=9764 RepID=A0AB34G8E5_ESCRO|nr:hypothetical protein J1605_016177 [Eschrichtius robustus]
MMFEPQLLPPFPIGEAQSPKQGPTSPRGAAGEPGWQMRPPSDHGPQTQAPYKELSASRASSGSTAESLGGEFLASLLCAAPSPPVVRAPVQAKSSVFVGKVLKKLYPEVPRGQEKRAPVSPACRNPPEKVAPERVKGRSVPSMTVAPHGALSRSDSVPERWSLLLAWPGNLVSTNPNPPWTRSQRQAGQAQGMPAAHRLDLQK